MARSNRPVNLPAPYLRRIWLEPERVPRRDRYPFALPAFRDEFELSFERPITIIVGENGTGKSTLLEAIAALIGYDDAGGGLGYHPVDHSGAIEATGGELAQALKASWLPRLRNGWFFKAESFFSVARYLDEAAKGQGPPPDFLSHSHGEGFLRFFEERCKRQGVYIFDEPESALSPARQIDFLRLLARMDAGGRAQVILATHSPLLMSYPRATLLAATPRGFEPTTLEATSHWRLWSAFAEDPHGFVRGALAGGDDGAGYSDDP